MAPDTRRQEVLLFRLLQSCESACSASAEWSGSAQAHHAVETAREQLAELAASGLSGPAKASYAARTEALRARLRPAPRPAYLRAPLSRAALPLAPSLPGAGYDSRRSEAFTGLRRRGASGVVSSETTAALRLHSSLHEELTDELVDMAAGLKRNAYAMDAGVRESLAVLDGVEVGLERSLAGTRSAADRAQHLHKVNRAGCWQTCMVLAAVTLVFVWMVALIRLNRNRLAPLLAQKT